MDLSKALLVGVGWLLGCLVTLYCVWLGRFVFFELV